MSGSSYGSSSCGESPGPLGGTIVRVGKGVPPPVIVTETSARTAAPSRSTAAATTASLGSGSAERRHGAPYADRPRHALDRDLARVLAQHPVLDRLFLGASHAGDWSAIWHVLSLSRGLLRGRPDQVLVLAAAIGAESLIVNQGVKRLFRRERPTTSGDERFAVRTPTTSAFPSGHASGGSGVAKRIAMTIATSGTTTGRGGGRGTTLKTWTTCRTDGDRGTRRTPSEGTTGIRSICVKATCRSCVGIRSTLSRTMSCLVG